MFPGINTLRQKNITVNNKEVLIKPWTNVQLSQYEGAIDKAPDSFIHDTIKDTLISPNIETKHKLTLLDEKIILIELYKLSKSVNVDITYTCKNTEACGAEGVRYVIDLEKDIKYVELKSRTIQTKNMVFNLRKFSTHRIQSTDIDETLAYLASYVDSFEYKNKEYPVTDSKKFKDWLINECPSDDFNDFINQWNQIKPNVESEITLVCEYCQHEQKMEFNLTDFL